MAATLPTTAPVAPGALVDLARSTPTLMAENALLRYQRAIPRRGVRRPRCTPVDRALLVLLAGRVRAWRSALLFVRPDTLLRWHRQLFRRCWRWRSCAAAPAHRPPLAPATVALIRAMAEANARWGAARIRGELLKLDIRVATWMVQKYMRDARPPRRAGQPRATVLRNHAAATWACDVLPVTAILFRHRYAFVVVARGSRQVVHSGVTRHPTDARVAQQRREAPPFERHPR